MALDKQKIQIRMIYDPENVFVLNGQVIYHVILDRLRIHHHRTLNFAMVARMPSMKHSGDKLLTSSTCSQMPLTDGNPNSLITHTELSI
jgi:hypothetical protein